MNREIDPMESQGSDSLSHNDSAHSPPSPGTALGADTDNSGTEGVKRKNGRYGEGARLPMEHIGALDLSTVSSSRQERLDLFPPAFVAKVVEATGGDNAPAWPRFKSCLAMLFIARSGSSFLSKELEQYYNIGKMGEHLNKHDKIKSGAIQARFAKRQTDRWFSFKGGYRGVTAAEVTGLMDQTLSRTHFLRLLRRDAVAQAVSMVKAQQSQQWDKTEPKKANPEYNLAHLEYAVARIVSGAEVLRVYAARTGRPSQKVIYEDVSGGDLTTALAACDALGIPRRRKPPAMVRTIERMPREGAEEWAERFKVEMGPKTREWLDKYQEILSL